MIKKIFILSAVLLSSIANAGTSTSSLQYNVTVANDCKVSFPTAGSYGTYDITNGMTVPLNFNVDCNNGTAWTLTRNLTPFTHSTSTATLTTNLFKDAGLTDAFGSAASVVGAGISTASVPVTTYLQIPGGQYKKPGTYTATLNFTIGF